jgi:hypothetical protein
MMATLINFFTQSSDDQPGVVEPVTAAADSMNLARGTWKIAAMGTDLLWKLGDDDVTTGTGSFLAAGDQEVVLVTDVSVKLSWIRASLAADDGEINVVPVIIFDVPGQDLANY